MRIWTVLMSLIVACSVAASAPAQGTTQPPVKKHPLLQRFEAMDTNHDGILTAAEFEAAHAKLGEKAAAAYKELAALGGTTTKDGATGMTFEQFKKAHQEWKQAHPGKKAGSTT